jgi:Family of unknown function (DUF5670)
MSIFTILFVVLLIAWLLGLSVFHVAAGFIHILLIFAVEGYLLHSGNPNRLWFRFRLGFWVKNPIQRNRLDCHRLLCEAEEELATAL